MTIIELDDDTVRRIAAGEVVERPASAVKELLENSLDADAGRIDVEVVAGGKARIAVADDGVGMTPDEARLAVQEHTTSKLDGPSDLAAGIGTLGFRGEALYAIGAVSRLTLTTRPRDGGSSGAASTSSDGGREVAGDEATRVTVDHGDLVDVTPAGRGPGTTVEVTELFSDMPAREQFLAADATEFDHVNRIASRYALANPDVAVSLTHDGREVFATAGQGDLEGALLGVYGREVAESMRRVDGDGVSGAVSHPEVTRSTREYVSTFVNGRYVASGELRGAVVEAYGRQLAPDRYPFAVVFVDVDPAAVDVNVHPRKLEVRFDDAAAVRERVRAAVEDALLEGGLLRAGAPRGRSAPAEVDPVPEPADGGSEATQAAEASPEDVSSASGATSSTSKAASSGPRAPSSASGDPSASEAPGSPAEPPGARESPTEVLSAGSETSPPDREPPAWHAARRVRSSGTQTTLDDEALDETGEFDRLPPLRVLGQLDDTYVVCEASGGLVLVDQHAADERVHYERLAAELADAPGSQRLAEPVELELTAREAELFGAFVAALEALGFRADRAGERTVEVTAVPAPLEGALDAGLLRDVLPELARDGEARSLEERADGLLADLACHPAVTGHTSLAVGTVRSLLEALDGCENPYACPHGRPTMIEVSAEELADRFERDYPGHTGRRDHA